mmetsp:Transcript_11878/g.38186  ORF Transcript_11878/g.38186 Transcript_11878/m.38186 type:complete len:323 (-) Transcript_11878:99-1067(-)
MVGTCSLVRFAVVAASAAGAAGLAPAASSCRGGGAGHEASANCAPAFSGAGARPRVGKDHALLQLRPSSSEEHALLQLRHSSSEDLHSGAGRPAVRKEHVLLQPRPSSSEVATSRKNSTASSSLTVSTFMCNVHWQCSVAARGSSADCKRKVTKRFVELAQEAAASMVASIELSNGMSEPVHLPSHGLWGWTHVVGVEGRSMVPARVGTAAILLPWPSRLAGEFSDLVADVCGTTTTPGPSRWQRCSRRLRSKDVPASAWWQFMHPTRKSPQATRRSPAFVAMPRRGEPGAAAPAGRRPDCTAFRPLDFFSRTRRSGTRPGG